MTINQKLRSAQFEIEEQTLNGLRVLQYPKEIRNEIKNPV